MPGRQEQRPTEQVLRCLPVGSQGEALDLTKENGTEEHSRTQNEIQGAAGSQRQPKTPNAPEGAY